MAPRRSVYDHSSARGRIVKANFAAVAATVAAGMRAGRCLELVLGESPSRPLAER